jgi:hypothetical protein
LYVHDYPPRSCRERRMTPDELVRVAEQMVQDA